MLRSFLTLFALTTILSTNTAFAYDVEDYATTERATYEALLKAQDEFILSGPPHKAALEAYRGAVLEYSSSIKIPSPSGDLNEVNILKQK